MGNVDGTLSFHDDNGDEEDNEDTLSEIDLRTIVDSIRIGRPPLKSRFPDLDPFAQDVWTGQYSYLGFMCTTDEEDGIHFLYELLEYDVDLTRRGPSGFTLLCLACQTGNTQLVIQLLIRDDCDKAVNICGPSGRTPLHWASSHNDFSMVFMLLMHGADPHIEDNESQTPLQCFNDGRSNEDIGRDGVSDVPLLIAEWAFSLTHEWRPTTHSRFFYVYRACMRTLVILAKAWTRTGNTFQVHYPHACLHLLPEEIMQYLFAWITTDIMGVMGV